jgi:hypothetical protein
LLKKTQIHPHQVRNPKRAFFRSIAIVRCWRIY